MFDAGKTIRMIGLPHGETRRMAIASWVSWVGLYAPRTIAVNDRQPIAKTCFSTDARKNYDDTLTVFI